MKWNISVIKGKEIKRDCVSSGERKCKKPEKNRQKIKNKKLKKAYL